MNTRTKEADYHKYCRICKHAKVLETDDPCNDCLNQPYNIDSRKPINFEEQK